MKYLLGLLFSLYTPVILAAKPVIDVANLAKNAVIAMQSENQTAVQLKQLAEQTLMYENMVQNSRVLPDFKLSQKLLGTVAVKNKDIKIDVSKEQNRHLDYGYSTTAHKAQTSFQYPFFF